MTLQKLKTLQARSVSTKPADEPKEAAIPQETWDATLQELRIGLYAAFGQSFKHLEDPLVLAYWYRQFEEAHLTPNDVLTALRQVTRQETKAPTLADFLSLAKHLRSSRIWWEQHRPQEQPS